MNERQRPGETWSPPDLTATVACVTGGSYGVGRGIARVLGECGATVYVTGRSTRSAHPAQPDWTVEATAELVSDAGGRGIPVTLDHRVDVEVRQLVGAIEREAGRLDLLVNNVWQWGPPESYFASSWDQPIERWDAMFGVGVRAQFVMTTLALPLMVRSGSGLIVFTQERPGTASRFAQNIVVDAASSTSERLARFLGQELRPRGVAALLVYPGWVRTVNMGMGFDPGSAGMTREEFHRRTQSPNLIGRAVAALAADDRVLNKAGRTLYAGELAREYGFTDVDGRIPDYETDP